MPKDKKRKQQHDDDEDYDKKPIHLTKDSEWADFENYYIEAVQDIEVPTDLDAHDILRINGEIDEVYSIARFDYNYAKRMVKKLNTKLSNAKKTLKLVYKKTAKITADERDALIIQHLESSPLKGDKEPLMTLVERWEDREAFMDAVIDNLLRKSEKMVNGNGALKLDAQGRGETGKMAGRGRR